MALSSRFTRTWAISSRSAGIISGMRIVLTRLTSAFSACGARRPATSITSKARSIGFLSIPSASTRDKSSRSAERRTRRSDSRMIVPKKRGATSPSWSAPSSSVSAMALMDVSGVRSSWETFATKSRRTRSSRRSSVRSRSTSRYSAEETGVMRAYSARGGRLRVTSRSTCA